MTNKERTEMTRMCTNLLKAGGILTALSAIILVTEAAGAAFFIGPIGIGTIVFSILGIICINRGE